MTIVVRMFARAKDLAGADQVRVELADPATVASIRAELARVVPALAGLLERSAVAVEGEFAKDDVLVGEGSEVALLPPVSGG